MSLKSLWQLNNNSKVDYTDDLLKPQNESRSSESRATPDFVGEHSFSPKSSKQQQLTKEEQEVFNRIKTKLIAYKFAKNP